MGTFNETGAVGLKLVREAGETKMSEIRAHMVPRLFDICDHICIAIFFLSIHMGRRVWRTWCA